MGRLLRHVAFCSAVAWSLMVPLVAMAQPRDAQVIELFTRQGCPRCAEARAFLDGLRRARPELDVRVRRIDEDPRAMQRLRELASQHGVSAPGVPAFWVREQLLVGFDGPDTTGRKLIEVLDGGVASDASGAVCSPGAEQACEPLDDGVATRWFGTLRPSELGLPLFTLALGLLDGFNPCAMWVLLFLLSMLVSFRDRRKMAAVAGTFVVVSGLVYFAFMAAWLNVFLLVGMSRVVQTILGAVALAIGAINVKDFFAFKRGISLSIPESAKPSIYARTRRILRAESLATSIAGVAVLAALVNVVELLCTAGFPAVYTAILASQKLTAAQHYGYLALYNLAYIADDGLMVSIAVLTLSKKKLTERAGRWLKLTSGVVMLGLAAGLLLFPELLR